jgi:succinate dehydrogenase flavin-adding protein (antitoxin of CptAB toxin-antitoxin module)
MVKFYRGTTIREANELILDEQTRDLTHWTDSYSNAAKYSKGAVVEIVMDELPPHFNAYRGVCEGDALHGTFAEWVLPRDYFEERACCFVEEAYVHLT